MNVMTRSWQLSDWFFGSSSALGTRLLHGLLTARHGCIEKLPASKDQDEATVKLHSNEPSSEPSVCFLIDAE